jgi:tetratricopeptide (TPR) repeat protein
MKQMLFGILISLFVMLSTDAQAFSSDKNYRQLLNDYYLQDKESLLSQDIIDVAQTIVANRNDYSQKVVARAFSLLSDIAFNRGNLLAAFQFAQYGMEIDETDAFIQLDLLLKLARGYHAQGKYIQLRDISQKAAWLAEQAKNMDYHLQALAYSAVAYALSADYALAITELIKVENLLSQNRQSVDQITLLEIIAEAHFNLAEYENTVELLNRVLKLRTDMSRTQGIARTYHLLANAYYQLQQYDDAFNAFWQSLQFSQHYKLYIRSAYAELGLGQVLFQQQQFTMAKERLLSAQKIFNQHNLVRMKLSAQIALAKVMYELGQDEQADIILLSAQSLAEKLVLSPQQIELYLLLTNYYQTQNEFKLAIEAQKRYLTLYQDLYPNVNVKNSLVTAAITSNKVKQLALNLAEKSELSLEFSAKYYRQETLIILLSIALFFSLFFAILWRFRLHHQRLNRGYDEIELPKNKVAQPTQTKRWYQQQYKMARKYQYNISIAYLVIENWQELSFHFNAKALADVSKALAIIINENIDEEDFAGEISAGEYLFLCPHQTLEQVLSKFTDIEQAIKTRFFANLGDYSVKVRFSVDSPSIQDIDPYVFLSRLSESTEAK